jgi:hypothetical protein
LLGWILGVVYISNRIIELCKILLWFMAVNLFMCILDDGMVYWRSRGVYREIGFGAWRRFEAW